jgi:hypothetical protein
MPLADAIAILISLGALAVSIVTYILRDSERGRLRFVKPSTDADEAERDDTRDGPYFAIINLSSFNVRIRRLIAETIDGTKYLLETTTFQNNEIPDPLPPRSAFRFIVEPNTFAGFADQHFSVYAETETGKRFKLVQRDRGSLYGYLVTVVQRNGEQVDAEVSRATRDVLGRLNRE